MRSRDVFGSSTVQTLRQLVPIADHSTAMSSRSRWCRAHLFMLTTAMVGHREFLVNGRDYHDDDIIIVRRGVYSGRKAKDVIL